ncbi:synaptotagmin-4 isoform X2 [Xenopus laevis]|uniref:Synaptotagmin-4 isoform X2 n=1 Tax=Xenopus laevis TaxID=8355 RepID=A0A8J1MMF5_XENLA|nr:synaptotagmin-4 isoform X2 [Xenopus laevis]XP_041442633.1 synaptotagmin-4 isoform X2 [Xenopus laevis]
MAACFFFISAAFQKPAMDLGVAVDPPWESWTVHLQILLVAGLALFCFCLLLGCAICWHQRHRSDSLHSLSETDKELEEISVRSAAVPIPTCYQDMDEDITAQSVDHGEDVPTRGLYSRASLSSLHRISSKTKRMLHRHSTLAVDYSQERDNVKLVRMSASRTDPSGLSKTKHKSHPFLHFSLHYSLEEESLTVTVTGLSNLPKKFHQKRESLVRVYLMPGFIEPLPAVNEGPDKGQKFLFCKYSPEQMKELTLRLAVYAQEKQSLREGFIGDVLFSCTDIDWQSQQPCVFTKELSVTKTKLKKSRSTTDVISPSTGQPKFIGQIFILLQYQCTASRVKVMVQKAENLGKRTRARVPGPTDHFVSIRLIQENVVKERKETRAATGSSPVWNAPFLFDIPAQALEEDTIALEFVIMQGRVHNRARTLGRVRIGAGASEAGLAHWKEMQDRDPKECARWHALQSDVF